MKHQKLINGILFNLKAGLPISFRIWLNLPSKYKKKFLVGLLEYP